MYKIKPLPFLWQDTWLLSIIVVEAGHVHVMKFLPLSCELSILGEMCGDDYFILFLFKLTIESKSIELFCTQFNSCMYKIKIKNFVHIIFVITFSTSLFINFFVYILQIIQKLNHKH
jgi:hypothetical protein